MKKTYSNTNYAGRNYPVPGTGLCVDVIISSEMITIIPEDFGPNEAVNEFACTRMQTVYSFRPEAYKRFWKWLSTSEESSYKYHPERMRAALTYALRLYRHKYGEIFN